MSPYQPQLSSSSLASQPFLQSSDVTVCDNELLPSQPNSDHYVDNGSDYDDRGDTCTIQEHVQDDTGAIFPVPDEAGFIRKLYSTLQTQSWINELLIWIFSLLLFTAIVVVLSNFDEKPFSDWRAPISLNTLLSALITFLFIFVSSAINMCVLQLKWNHFASTHPISDLVLFDQNAVSVYGSLSLLIKRPKNALVSLAAILTILITVIGPFVQQIISLEYVVQKVKDNNITLPVMTVPLTQDQIYIPEWRRLAGLALASEANTPFNVVPSCPVNANCTWPPYDTLIVISECQNITEHVQLDGDCTFTSDDHRNVNCMVHASCLTDSNGNLLICNSDSMSMNYSIPGAEGPHLNLVVDVQWENTSWDEIKIWHVTPLDYSNPQDDPSLLYNLSALSDPTTSLVFKGKGNVLCDFQLIEVTDLSKTNNTMIFKPQYGSERTTWPPNDENASATLDVNIESPIFAMECNFHLVGQKMNATYINNIFEETAIGHPVENNSAAAQTAVIPGTWWGLDEGDALYDCIFFAGENTGDTPLPLVACYLVAGANFSILQELVTDITFTFGSFEDYFGLIPNIDHDGDFETFYEAATAVMSNVGRIITQGLRTSTQKPKAFDDFIINYFNFEPLMNATFGSAQPPSVAYGTATRNVLVYKITWGWISLPASLLVFLGLLILFTEVNTRRMKIPVWRQSRLANVLHGADESTRRLLVDAEDRGQLDEVAKLTRVRLSRERGVLVAVTDELNEVGQEDGEEGSGSTTKTVLVAD
ncbi:hypothetical protein F5Y16DRAFT_40772 [Xylariaceae sp. FL0255]|nr:hypothetical protein F5Y16DRAFT_40772 [Xylariaceae sp. FL0255]